MMRIQSIRRAALGDDDVGEDHPLTSRDVHSRDLWPLIRFRFSLPGSISNTPIMVAVIDSGITEGNLSRSPLPAPTAIPGQTRDDEDHGTLVAGTIGLITAGARSVSGNTSMETVSGKFCSPQILPTANRAADAINAVAELKPHVMVLAWDVGYRTSKLTKAIDDLRDDTVVVVAAGNHATDNDRYPNWPANYGRLDHVITVMATDERDERASFSNFGAETVYIAAPGFVKLADAGSMGPHGTVRLGDRTMRGTSAAASLVAGLVAVIRAKKPEWPPSEVKRHLGTFARGVKALEKKNWQSGKRYCQTAAIADYEAAIGRLPQ
jgi:subtilisin family serine protease